MAAVGKNLYQYLLNKPNIIIKSLYKYIDLKSFINFSFKYKTKQFCVTKEIKVIRTLSYCLKIKINL